MAQPLCDTGSKGASRGIHGRPEPETAHPQPRRLPYLGLRDADRRSGINLTSLVEALIGGNSSYTINLGCYLGHCFSTTISLSSFLNDLGVGGNSYSINTILGDLGINTNAGITLGDILSAFGLSDSNTITPPAINIGDVLNFLGLSDSSSISIDSILAALGINPNEDIFSLFGISNPLTLSLTLDLTGGSVQAFDLALSQDLLAVLGSFSQLAQDPPAC